MAQSNDAQDAQEPIEDQIDPTDSEAQEPDQDATESSDSAEVSEADQVAELTADLQRLSAEFSNYQKRSKREYQSAMNLGASQVAAQLIPIMDDLDLAESHGDLADGPMKSLSDKFGAVLQDLSVEQFGNPGDEFDPAIHEAVQDFSEGEDKALQTVLRKGYKMGDRVLRTAMVILGDAQPGDASQDSRDDSATEQSTDAAEASDTDQ